jgi:hypothetical protein
VSPRLVEFCVTNPPDCTEVRGGVRSSYPGDRLSMSLGYTSSAPAPTLLEHGRHRGRHWFHPTGTLVVDSSSLGFTEPRASLPSPTALVPQCSNRVADSRILRSTTRRAGRRSRRLVLAFQQRRQLLQELQGQLRRSTREGRARNGMLTRCRGKSSVQWINDKRLCSSN